MFWSDWGASPRIERAGMNGAYRQTIIDSNKLNIQWPNVLTIDYPSDMLYWVDARYHLLATCDFNGDNYRFILRDGSTLMHPFQNHCL
ncbi:Low-density lipoprotein receptor-related protein 8 [Holothuria leucospilota]|uniref:Low-density lipoprotein receptor-related protein 8 n=1 Tax=Holothuria leucospilota TaxID=206669 RepID=A0A9Q1HJZ0_HOLLE|nr:Low-density lipoprotein receptor-related protein 8 [Holothuria leucospilota]